MAGGLSRCITRAKAAFVLSFCLVYLIPTKLITINVHNIIVYMQGSKRARSDHPGLEVHVVHVLV